MSSPEWDARKLARDDARRRKQEREECERMLQQAMQADKIKLEMLSKEVLRLMEENEQLKEETLEAKGELSITREAHRQKRESYRRECDRHVLDAWHLQAELERVNRKLSATQRDLKYAWSLVPDCHICDGKAEHKCVGCKEFTCGPCARDTGYDDAVVCDECRCE